MENNKKIRELYSIYVELGHEVFEEKIKKPMELYLHANSNVVSMNSLDTIIANAMEKTKLGEASFYENDHFSSPALEDSYSIAYDDTKPPIYDDYNDEYDILSPPTIEEKINFIYLFLSIGRKFTLCFTNSCKLFFKLFNAVNNFFCHIDYLQI